MAAGDSEGIERSHVPVEASPSAETGSATRVSGDGTTVLDLLVVLSENARLIILGSLAAGLVALGIAFLIPPTFTATARILPPPQQQSSALLFASQIGALPGLGGFAGLASRGQADLYVALIQSRTIADRIIDRFDLIQRYQVTSAPEARDVLSDMTRATATKEGVITLEFSDRDPQRAADIANAYVEELTRANDRLAITEAQQRRLIFERQLAGAEKNLVRAEAALKATGVSEDAVKANPESAVGVVVSLMTRVAAKEIQIDAMRSYLTESAPELRQARAELAALQAQLDRVDKAAKQTASSSDYLSKYRDFKYHEALYGLLLKQYEAAKLDEAREGAMIQVVDTAIPPERKSGPKRGKIAVLTTILAGILLVLFVLSREALRNAARDSRSRDKLLRIGSNLFRRE